MKNPLRGLRFSLLDFHSARANLGMKIAMLGIALIPLIYGALYLMAFYDPYGRLDTLPVAVVNEDVPVTTDSGDEIHAGDDLVEALEESGSLAYRFVDSADEAQKGLEAGTYYNTIVIPEDFSEKVASAQGDDPEQAHLVLVSNDANNYLSSILGASVMRQVTAETNYAITEGYLDEIFGIIDETGDSLGEAADGSRELADGLADAHDGSERITDGLSDAVDGASSLTSGLGDARNGSAQVTDGLGQVSQGASSLSAGLGQLKAGALSLADGASQVSDGAGQLANAVAAKSGDVSALQDGAQQVAGGLSELSNGLGTLASGADTARDCANGVSGILASLPADGSGNYTISADVMAQLQQLAGGATQAASGVSAGAAQAAGSAGQLAAGAAQVSGGVDKVAAGFSQLQAAASQLADGAADVARGAQGVATGASSARDGAASLSAGAGQARSGSNALTSGLRAAHDGSSQLLGGLDELHDGSAELTDGLADAESGSKELADGLAGGVESIEDATAGSQARTAMMSEPVELVQEHYTTVDNYGSGFAPYFIALGLWVGALVMTFLLKPFNNRLVTAGANPVTVGLSGIVPWLIVGAAQALLLALTIQFACGIDVAHPVAYYCLTILSSFVFCAIIQMITAALGFPGKFLAVVLLMLQLTTAAGTFPIETEFTVFQNLSPWLPMTYIVHALRQAMAGADLSLVGGDVAHLAAFFVAAFALTCLVAWRKRLVTMSDLHPLVDL